MHSINLIKYLFLGSILISFSATASPSQTTDDVALKQLSAEWMNAIERKDRKHLESILADNFILQMPGDTELQYVHRAEWLDNAIKMDWSNFRYENVVVKVHGNHATVSSKLFFKVAPNPLTFDSGVVDTWEKRGGKWQVTNRFLGESDLKQRISFLLGALALALAVVTGLLIVRLYKWARRRPA